MRVLLSLILTASIVYPDISGVLWILGGGTVLAVVGYAVTLLFRGRHGEQTEEVLQTYSKESEQRGGRAKVLATRWLAHCHGYPLVVLCGATMHWERA